jgi:hypothetical protein
MFPLEEFVAMKQSVLNRAVARATGESVRHIRQMGFVLLTVTAPGAEDDSESTSSACSGRAERGDQDSATPAA